MVNSHPITLSDNKLLPHCFFSHGELSPMALFLMVNSHPIALSYGELSPHRSSFHGELSAHRSFLW